MDYTKLKKDIDIIDISFKNVQSLENLEIKETVKVIDCSNNNLMNLKGCPKNVIELYVNCNLLKTLKDCSDNIEKLVINNNKDLKVDYLPPKLNCLICRKHQIDIYNLKILKSYKNDLDMVILNERYINKLRLLMN